MTQLSVMGVDPSLAATGLAFPDGSTATVKERGLKGDKRLVLLYTSVMDASAGADLAIVEDTPTNAMGAGLTAKAQGVVRLALHHAHVPYIAISPASIKKAATGKGNAKKDAMREAMELFTGELPKDVDDNQVDAWWIRQCGLYLSAQPSYIHVDGEDTLNKYAEEYLKVMRGESSRHG